MTGRVEDLLSQLEAISPMPNDHLLTEQVLEKYDRIVRELSEHRDFRCVQPLIRSFGYGSGYGVYWSVVHLLEKFDSQSLEPVLISALQQGSRGTRMWSALMLGRMRSAVAVPSLVGSLDDTEELVRSHAVIALDMIGAESTRKHIEPLLDDPSSEVRSAAKRALTNLD